MAPIPTELTILYHGAMSGIFENGVAPLTRGTYPYMPLRSPPHLQMCEAVRAGERPRCRYHLEGDRISFDVVAIPESHHLTLERFSRCAEPQGTGRAFESFFLGREANALDLFPWRDLLPSGFRVLRVSQFLDVIIIDRMGAIHLLSLAAKTIRPLAPDQDALWDRLEFGEAADWERQALVLKCCKAGKRPRLWAGECYALEQPEFAGGAFEAANVVVASAAETVERYASTR